MHHFVTEMYTYVHISVTKWCIVGMVNCGISETGLFSNYLFMALINGIHWHGSEMRSPQVHVYGSGHQTASVLLLGFAVN